jgi:atypical dual specificity phosphatase
MAKSIKENAERNMLWFLGKACSYVQPAINWVKSNPFNIDEVISGIYIGDFASACNYTELKKNNITHIVTAILGVGEMNPNEFKYHIVDIADRSYEDISKHFNACSEFINDAIIKGGKVLIHCQCGVSRSSTLIAAYLIKKRNFSATGAIETIKKSRNFIQPNTGFMQQLISYENSLSKDNS